MSAVHGGQKLKDIDFQAFYGCSSLKHVDVLSKTNKNKLHNIGVSAFAESGLEDVYISLSGTSVAT